MPRETTTLQDMTIADKIMRCLFIGLITTLILMTTVFCNGQPKKHTHYLLNTPLCYGNIFAFGRFTEKGNNSATAQELGFFDVGNDTIGYINLGANVQKDADDSFYSAMRSMPVRLTLEDALAQSVDNYKNILQTVGTSIYYSNSEALTIILGYDDIIEEAAVEYDVDMAMIQSVLFQEMRFFNILDEVDTYVQSAYILLHEREAQQGISPWQLVILNETILTGFYVSDSSTGLGQIYAKSAIKALNWYNGAALYDYNNWKDREKIWLKLKYDDAFNINIVGLMCRYNEYILKNEKHIPSPTARDIFRTYNGAGPLAEKYEEVTYHYFLAFQEYNQYAA